MKRNCNDCKAFEVGKYSCTCILGHKITTSKEMWGIPTEYRPCEECEKPKTYTELLEAKKTKGYYM